jgi:hypothetical protein
VATTTAGALPTSSSSTSPSSTTTASSPSTLLASHSHSQRAIPTLNSLFVLRNARPIAVSGVGRGPMAFGGNLISSHLSPERRQLIVRSSTSQHRSFSTVAARRRMSASTGPNPNGNVLLSSSLAPCGA